jgi:aminoglycoside phosphotransferase (APT) family kinase protein
VEETWGRLHAFVRLEPETLQELLQPVFPGKRPASIELLTEGHCNTNYKITFPDSTEAVVLRIYMRDQGACRKNLNLFRLLYPHVPIPEVLYADPDMQRFDKPYAVLRWIEGPLLSKIQKHGTEAELAICAYAVGQTLAQIGSYRFPEAGILGPELTVIEPFQRPDTFLTLLEEIWTDSPAVERLGSRETTWLLNFVQRNSYLLVSGSDAIPRLTHGDYKGINILVRPQNGSWQTAAVLDWEFAFADTPLFDIGNMLRYAHRLPHSFEQAFIRGYREYGGFLPPAWRIIAKLLDLLSLSQFLQRPTASAGMIAEVRELILHTLHTFDRKEEMYGTDS